MRFISIFPQKYERINLTTNSKIFVKDVAIKKKVATKFEFCHTYSSSPWYNSPEYRGLAVFPSRSPLEIQCWLPLNSEKQKPKNVRIVGKKCFYVSPNFFQQFQFDSLKFFLGGVETQHHFLVTLIYRNQGTLRTPNKKAVS